jgi:hypothetical protein
LNQTPRVFYTAFNILVGSDGKSCIGDSTNGWRVGC